MVILLVAITFAIFVGIDALLERRRRHTLAHEGEALHARLRESEPEFVAGYEMPGDLHYHRGHLWVHWVAPDQAFVGLDDFARRLVGHPDKVVVPHVGSWTDQGEATVEVRNGVHNAELQAPLSGEVIAVNPALRNDPDAVHRDSYGRGWLYKIRSHRLAEQLNGLLDGSLAERWMEDTRDRFHHQLVLASGSVIQDGGTTVEDLAAQLDPELYDQLVEEFLSSRPQGV
jgi:glycine cleavage system H protein